MDNKEKTIKRWLKNDDITLDEMYEKCFDRGWTQNTVETQEDLRYFICSMINRDCAVAPLLQSIEDNTAAEYFEFDVTGWSNTPARPIYDKDDLANCLI